MRLSATESALLSDSERKLVLSKGPWHVKDLVKVIQRTRSLRDKQADLVRRQTISTARRSGSKSGVSGVANARTAAKGRVFERALQEFETQLDAINVESSNACKSLLSGSPSKPKPAAKRSAATSTTAGKPSKSAASSKAATRSAKSAKPAKATKATKAAKPAKPTQPAKAAKPAKAVKPAKAAAGKPAAAASAVARPDPKVHRPGKVRIALPLNPSGSSAPQLAGQASRRSRGMKTR